MCIRDRHYDAEEVLRPSAVDAAPGYRRYGRDQVAIGRLVADLRFLQLGLGDIRTYLSADADHRTDILVRHRARVAGDRAAASDWKAKAVASLDAIADPDDREVIQRDIDLLPL